MGNQNYNKISTMAAKQAEVKEIEEVVEETVTTAPETPVVETTEDAEEEVIEFVVYDCVRLNIRKNPSLSAKVLCAVDAGSVVCVFPEEGTANDEWSLVVTESGIEGYCMTKYLTEKK